MIEAHQNQLGFSATDSVRWPTANRGPDGMDFFPAEHNPNVLVDFPSRPIPMHAMQIATFQCIYSVEDAHEPTYFGLVPHFQVSQDCMHWDDIDDASFSVDLSTVVIDGISCVSVTISVLNTTNYIRLTLTRGDGPGHSETEPNAGDSFRAYFTLKEA